MPIWHAALNRQPARFLLLVPSDSGLPSKIYERVRELLILLERSHACALSMIDDSHTTNAQMSSGACLSRLSLASLENCL